MQLYFSFVFFRKEIIFNVKIFWPYRSKAKGFSIKKLADKNLDKTSSVSSLEIASQFSSDRNIKSIKKDSHYIAISHLAVKRGHWANRDFSEYREVA